MSFLKDILPIMKRNSQSLERFFSSFHLFNFSTLVKRKNLSTFQLFNVSTLLVAAVCAATSAAVAANFPLGTHLIKGTLKDWQNKVLTSSAAVTIQAVATNGTVLASTKVADPSADGYNFLLQIPLATKATDSTAAVGDTLNCVLVQESGLSLAATPFTVGDANAVSSVCLELINMKSYTKDGQGTVTVPAEYVDTIAAWMEAYEIEGDYDPFADYDNDGASNYAEYRAGTNPFDDTDKLAITAYAMPQSTLHAISFEYVGGHIYGVATTRSLTNPEWAVQKVKKTETDADHEQVMLSADEDDVGATTIYVVPAEGATSQFFKLEARSRASSLGLKS